MIVHFGLLTVDRSVAYSRQLTRTHFASCQRPRYDRASSCRACVRPTNGHSLAPNTPSVRQHWCRSASLDLRRPLAVRASSHEPQYCLQWRSSTGPVPPPPKALSFLKIQRSSRKRRRKTKNVMSVTKRVSEVINTPPPRRGRATTRSSARPSCTRRRTRNPGTARATVPVPADSSCRSTRTRKQVVALYPGCTQVPMRLPARRLESLPL